MATDYSTAKAPSQRELTALFKIREDADSMYEWLLKNGYASGEIHILMSEETRKIFHYEDVKEIETTSDDAVSGLQTGAVFGGGLGAALGILAAVGSMVIIPGMGLALAGPLAASLAGAGGLVGGALGALYGSGVPEEKAQELERQIREGSILISVVPHTPEETARIETEYRVRNGEIIFY